MSEARFLHDLKTMNSKDIGRAIASASLLAWVLGKAASSRFRWNGKTVFITGGSRGLGLILARKSAERGARVAFCARDPREIERAIADLCSYTSRANVLGLRCDVSNTESLHKALTQAEQELGKIDVLINNASVIQVGPAESMAEKEFREAMSTNFWPLVHSTLHLLPVMKRDGAKTSPRIVNITSIGGAVPVPHLLPYVCAKFAALGFSQALRIEAARYGVRITTIVPGLMRTGSFVNALFKGKQESEFLWFALSSTAPLLTVDAERAADRILLACERGESLVTLGLPAKILRLSYALFPNLMTGAASLANRWILPAPPSSHQSAGGAEKFSKPGYLYRTRLSRKPFTYLGDKAAERFHQQLS